MDQLSEVFTGISKAWEKWRNRVGQGETSPVLEPGTNLEGVRYGSFVLASPNHPPQDDCGNSGIIDNQGRISGLRFFVIDGSGGTGRQTEVQRKVVLIKKAILYRMGLEAERCLDEVNKLALQDSNRAVAAAVVVDVLPDRIRIVRRGDPTVVRFNGDTYPTRRGEGWPNTQRGAPSPFQLIDVPQNVAYSLKTTGQGETRLLDEEPSSSQIFSGVGTSGPTSTLEVERSEIEEWLLVSSDGAQGGSRLLDPDDPYSCKVKGVMVALRNGTISEADAARQISLHAREIPGENDDITVQVIRVPPGILRPTQPIQDPQAILAKHEKGARRRGTPAAYDRAHGEKWTNMG